jgi:hypothetical protein
MSIDETRVLALKETHLGEQCVILCPGPSAKDIDLSILNGHPHVHGANGAYMLRNKFRYWFCTSMNFYAPNAPQICKVDCSLYFLTVGLGGWLDRVRELSRPPEEKTIYLDVDSGKFSDEVSYDLTQKLPWGPTVLLSIALPTILWMGYSRILLVGADYPLLDYRHVYEGLENAPMHFLDRSQSGQQREMIIAHRQWHIWERYLKLQRPDVRIINCSIKSELTMWEKVPLEQALKI